MDTKPNLMPYSLPDDPHLEEHGDGARNHDVVETLEALFARHQSQGGPFIRVGLFGGLGQGKTSAWRAAASRIPQPGSRLWAWVKKHVFQIDTNWYMKLDVADHKEDSLEHEFDKLILAMTASCDIFFKVVLPFFLRFFVFVLIPSLLGLYLLLSMSAGSLDFKDIQAFFGGKQYQGGLIFICWAILGIGVRRLFSTVIWPAWGKSWEYSTRNIQRKIFQDVDNQAQFRFGGATWLIIDNLDRATERQQKAIFRSLYKFEGRLPFSVLVCMDETTLLLAKPDPEAPVELINKAIQLQVRMPGRVPLDACRLAWQACATPWPGREGQAECWQRLLADLRVAAGLARAMVLLDSNSPRQAKRLLNDANLLHWQLARQRMDAVQDPVFSPDSNLKPGEQAKLQQEYERKREERRHKRLEMEIASVAEWLAALRTVMLTQSLPALRGENMRLAGMLTKNNTDSFAGFVNEVAAAHPHLARQTVKIFSATRHWRPRHGEWLPFVAIAQLMRGTESAELAEDDLFVRANVLPADFRVFDHLWRCCQHLAAGYGGDLLEHNQVLELLQKKLDSGAQNNEKNIAQAMFLAVDMYCCLAPSASEALRLIGALAPWQENIMPLPAWVAAFKRTEVRSALWVAVAARDDTGAVISRKQLRQWLLACRDNGLRLAIASLMPARLLAPAETLAICAAHDHARLDEIMADFCLDASQSNPVADVVWEWPKGESVNKHLGRYWPPLSPQAPDLFPRLAEQLRWWRLHLAGKAEMLRFPDSLHYLLLEDPLLAARLLEHPQQEQELLKALREMFAAPGATPQNWSFLSLQKMRRYFAAQTRPVQRAWRLRIIGFLLRARARLRRIQIPDPDSVLTLRLLALSLGLKGLYLCGQSLPPSTPEQARLLALLVANEAWRHQVPASLWQWIFASTLRSPIFPRGELGRYWSSLHQTHLLLAENPGLGIETIAFLLEKIFFSPQPGRIKQAWLDDIKLLQGGQELPEDLAAKLALVKESLAARKETWQGLAQFTDRDAYQLWLYKVQDALAEGIIGLTEDAFFLALHARVNEVMRLAPADLTEDEDTAARAQLLQWALKMRQAALPHLTLVRTGNSSEADTVDWAQHGFAGFETIHLPSDPFAAAKAMAKAAAALAGGKKVLLVGAFEKLADVLPCLDLSLSAEVIEIPSAPALEALPVCLQRLRREWGGGR